MSNYSDVFRSFYNQYDISNIKKAYRQLSQKSIFSQFYKNIPFSVEIRMKNDVFAMQLDSQRFVSMELMTVIGLYFDKYSEERKCVYTKSRANIKNFFEKGIEDFIEYGGSIIYTLNLSDKEKIVDLFFSFSPDSESHSKEKELRQRLIDNFDMLQNTRWGRYCADITKQIEREEQEKHIEEVTCMDLPLDWENVFSSDERAAGVAAKSPADGLVLSLNNLGRVDIEYISQITGEDCKTVIGALKGSIFQNPDTWNECFYKGWETADEYLSGRVTEKLQIAKKADKEYNGYFRENTAALQKVVPPQLSSGDIYVTLGSPWVPPDIIDAFIAEIMHNSCHLNDKAYNTIYDEATGVWRIPLKSRGRGSYYAEEVYGTKRLNAYHILEITLNMKAVCVTDEASAKAKKNGENRMINKDETILALERQKKMIADFKEWVWKDPDRKKRLLEIYNSKYCVNVIRHYNGSFLKFPDMNPAEKLFDYQKDAVARIMFAPNTLLAHEVGAGKTYEMVCAGMEMRRIGISKKNLYVKAKDGYLELLEVQIEGKKRMPAMDFARGLHLQSGDVLGI